jgi:hypothetical protein
MTLTVTCPHCCAARPLTRPALLPAPVRCRACRRCFYADGPMPSVAAALPAAAPPTPPALIPAHAHAAYFTRPAPPRPASGWRGPLAGLALWAAGLCGLCGLCLAALR